jgi:hypothetical protein
MSHPAADPITAAVDHRLRDLTVTSIVRTVARHSGARQPEIARTRCYARQIRRAFDLDQGANWWALVIVRTTEGRGTLGPLCRSRAHL